MAFLATFFASEKSSRTPDPDNHGNLNFFVTKSLLPGLLYDTQSIQQEARYGDSTTQPGTHLDKRQRRRSRVLQEVWPHHHARAHHPAQPKNPSAAEEPLALQGGNALVAGPFG